MAFQLRDKGAIDDDVYRSIEDLHIRFMANPGARIWWKMVDESVVEEQFARIINEKLSSIEGTERATTEAWAFFDAKNWRDPDEPDKPLQLKS
jgi:hypothetical protein